jgi:hypothetical protein
VQKIELNPNIKVESPKVNVEAPVVNVEQDFTTLEKALKDVLKAVQKIAIPEVPKTDLSGVEKALEKQSKQLTKLIEKPGSSFKTDLPFQDSDGNIKRVTLVNGVVPITQSALTKRFDYSSSTIIYTATAPVGTAESSTGWTITKFDLTNSGDSSGKIATDVSWDNRAAGVYA